MAPLPDHPWTELTLQVVVEPSLEDIAGNNFRDLLDEVLGDEPVAPVRTCLPVCLRSPHGLDAR